MSAYKRAAAGTRMSEGDDQGQRRAQWSTQAYTVEEVLQQFTLPQVVKCNPQAILVKRESPLPVNLAHPILLFDARTVRKLLARNVVYDQATGKFGENEETVVIPRDYEGAFLRLRSRTSKDHTTHKEIETMAIQNIKAFLNLTKMAAFRLPGSVTQIDGRSVWTRVDYMAGNVFAIDGIFQGSAKVRQESKFLNHKQTAVQQVKYLKCRDETNLEVIIPMSQKGEFVEIIPNTLSKNENGRLSVTSQDLIESQNFPIVVRYIKGRYRPRLTSFTGMFTLLDSYEETTIIGCVLDQKGCTLMELPIASPLTFHLALNMHELQSHPVVRNALRLCETNGQNYARDLKYKFKFAQRFFQMSGKKYVDDGDDLGGPPSARNSAKVGVTTTYIYL